MMKLSICQVLPALEMGGVERGTLDIAQAIVERGHESIVMSEGGKLVSGLESKGSSHISLPLSSKNPLTILKNAKLLKKLASRMRIDLFHARSRAPAWSALIAAKALRLPFVTTYHGTYSGQSLLKKLYNKVMTKGEVIIAPSIFIRNHILKTYGYHLAPKIRVIHRGVDTDAFKPSKVLDREGKAFREKIGVPEGAKLIMMPARYSRWKGHEDFIELMFLFTQSYPNQPIFGAIIGKISGREGYVAQLQSMIDEIGLASKITLCDAEEDMPVIYAAADLILSPSREPEAFGRVVAEAGAMEKPVIATDHGGAREIIRSGTTGWLVPLGAVPMMVDMMAHAFKMSAREKKMMGKAARARIQDKFSLKNMQIETLKIYEQLCSKGESS
jgi:glycosyltransferase involved in cell wall biosynthesis